MDRNKNLHSIIRMLLDERTEYADWQIPDSLPKQQMMMRSLLNVRSPHPVDDDFLKAQDTELQRQLADKGVVALSDIAQCSKDGRLRLWQGDITRLQVDAIVNAANSALLGCFVPMHRCIDNAIHSAAGIQLRLACPHSFFSHTPLPCMWWQDGYTRPQRRVFCGGRAMEEEF